MPVIPGAHGDDDAPSTEPRQSDRLPPATGSDGTEVA